MILCTFRDVITDEEVAHSNLPALPRNGEYIVLRSLNEDEEEQHWTVTSVDYRLRTNSRRSGPHHLHEGTTVWVARRK